MKKIDIIILSNTADNTYHNLFSITVNSIKEQTNIESNVILVETNNNYKKKEQYTLPIDVLVVPNEKFNFNRFLNHGLAHSTADYICFSNNDVKYYPNSLYNIIEGLQSYDSVSPHGINYAHDFKEGATVEHCVINRSFLGWCYCFTRRTMNECFGGKFDEQFEFYRQDEDIVETLHVNKFKHAVVGLAKAEHLDLNGNIGRGANSYNLLGTKEDVYYYTEHPRTWNMFHKKWRSKFF